MDTATLLAFAIGAIPALITACYVLGAPRRWRQRLRDLRMLLVFVAAMWVPTAIMRLVEPDIERWLAVATELGTKFLPAPPTTVPK